MTALLLKTLARAIQPGKGHVKPVNTLIQCDFDGTIIEHNVTSILLAKFADQLTQRLLTDYRAGRISVEVFVMRAYTAVKASRKALLEEIEGKIDLRAGFQELVSHCHTNGIRLVIVSDGLDFYIRSILRDHGLGNIELYAARARFAPEGIQVRYTGPDGMPMSAGFKEAYVRLFLRDGYWTAYAGNGMADVEPARRCDLVFATRDGDLMRICREDNVDCVPFTDFTEVVTGLEALSRGNDRGR